MLSFKFSFSRRVARDFFLVLVAAATCSQATAQGQNSPALPTAWTASGGTPSFDSAGNIVAIPSGGTATRRYATGRLEVRLVSRPFFSATPTGWPTLEVGPVSLTLLRDGKGGGLVFLGSEPLVLPFSIALGADGRSAAPLEFTLTYDKGLGQSSLAINGTTFTQTKASDATLLEVALSAGTESTWPITTLEIRSLDSLVPPVSASSGVARVGAATTTGNGKPLTIFPAEQTASRRKAYDDARTLFGEGKDDDAEDALAAASRRKQNSVPWHLELANQLVQISFQMNRENDAAGAKRVALRALQHTAKAVKQAKQDGPDTAVPAHQLAAFINERLLGDYQSALASLQDAKGVSADDEGTNKALRRLEKIGEEAAKKKPEKGK